MLDDRFGAHTVAALLGGRGQGVASGDGEETETGRPSHERVQPLVFRPASLMLWR